MSSPREPPLPAMSDAILSHDQLTALFQDYRACATEMQIQIKTGPGLINPHNAPSIDDAETMLLTGQLRGLQLRYRFGDQSWCDTLMRVAAGIRLVRCPQ